MTTKIPTKNVYDLNPDAWYMHLIEFIWGYHYTDFAGVCPIFWLTLFNCIFFIPIMIVKAVTWSTRGIIDRIESKQLKFYEAYYLYACENSEAVALKIHKSKLRSKYRKFLFDYLSNKDWKLYIIIRDRMYELEMIDGDKPTIKQKIQKDMAWIVPLGKIVGALGIVGIIYLIVRIIMNAVPGTLQLMLLIIGMVLVIIIGVILLSYIIEYLCISAVQKQHIVHKILLVIFWPFLKLTQAAVFVYTIIAIKCPAVKWVPKT